jgi:hypothetical protein
MNPTTLLVAAVVLGICGVILVVVHSWRAVVNGLDWLLGTMLGWLFGDLDDPEEMP